MSFITFACGGVGCIEAVKVEITRSGDLLFPNADIEYDLAMAEFGEQKTPEIDLYEKWKVCDATVIVRKLFNIDSNTLVLFAADCADHVLHLFESYSQGNMRARYALESIRYFVGSEAMDLTKNILSPGDLRGILLFMWSEINKDTSQPAYAASQALLSVARATYGADLQLAQVTSAWQDEVVNSILAARKAAGYHASVKMPPKKFLLAVESERLWQIRRFIDIMESNRAKKPWPPLGATP